MALEVELQIIQNLCLCSFSVYIYKALIRSDFQQQQKSNKNFIFKHKCGLQCQTLFYEKKVSLNP